MQTLVNFDDTQNNFKVDFEETHSTFKVGFKTAPSKLSAQFEADSSEYKATFDETSPKFDVSFGEKIIVPDIEPPSGNTVKIGDKVYHTFGAALNAVQSGDTIVLLSDVKYNAVICYTTDFCIDLNGYTLTSQGVSVFANGGSIVDNGSEKGLLAVPHGCLLLTHAKYEMLPLWNEEGTGYVFTNVTHKYRVRDEEVTETGCKILFLPSFSGGGVESSVVWADGALDNGVSFEITAIRYDDKGGVVSEFSMPAPDGNVASVYKNNKTLTFTFSGLARNSTYGIELILKSDTGLTYNFEYGRFNTGVFTPTAPMS